MKKLLSFLLVFMLIISVVPLGAFTLDVSAATQYIDGYYTYTVSNDKATITDVDESISGDITILSKFGVYPVTSIGDSAFSCHNLTSITIPDSVTSIGTRAFTGKRLTSINVSSDNKYYSSEGGVLFNKNATELIQYPMGKIDTSYVIPNSVTSIGDYAFSGCTSLTRITIPDSVTSIGSDAFGFCDVTNITIPDSVTVIGEAAFRNCGLTSITIPDSVISIGDLAFYNCVGLTSVTIPDSVISIGDKAFGNSGLTNITIPDSVTSIGASAFESCTSLTSVTIPNSVTSIGNNAFISCRHLKSVYITDIAAWCNIDFGVFTSNPLSWVDNLYLNGELVTELVIPDTITSIGDFAFYGCRALTSITIPDSVTSIGYYAFSNWTRLTSVTIPDSVISIGDKAFDNCTSLTSIIIPDSVTSIGNGAFDWCESLKDVWYTGTSADKSEIKIGSYNTKLTDATWHYNSCPVGAPHEYDNGCDTTCNNCDYTRDTNHVYTDDFDAICNECGTERDAKKHGDVNGDNTVNTRDYAILIQHLNGWGVEIDVDAADVNGDGAINVRDYSLLMQYLNGWDVELQ